MKTKTKKEKKKQKKNKTKHKLKNKLQRIKTQIQNAAIKSGRNPSNIKIIAVTKKQPIEKRPSMYILLKMMTQSFKNDDSV